VVIIDDLHGISRQKLKIIIPKSFRLYISIAVQNRRVDNVALPQEVSHSPNIFSFPYFYNSARRALVGYN